jgi:hypothetical protein
MLKIETRLDPVEIDNLEIKGLPDKEKQLTVSSHWNSNKLIVLDFNGHSITVVADELERAITNATNHS